MLPSQGFGARVRRAKHHLIERKGKAVSNTRLAELIAELLGTQPLTHATVGNWIRLGVMPDTDTVWALAEVCGVRPAWLALGEEPMVKPIPIFPDVAGAEEDASERSYARWLATEKGMAVMAEAMRWARGEPEPPSKTPRVILDLPPEMFEPVPDTRSAAKKAAAKAGGKKTRRPKRPE